MRQHESYLLEASADDSRAVPSHESFIEKRAFFDRRLLPLLDFESSRETIDVSKLMLKHHVLRAGATTDLPLGAGDGRKIDPISGAGAGQVNEKIKARLAEIIARLNDLFGGDLSDNDRVTYAFSVIKGKLLESEKLRQQAANNTKEQFAASPDLNRELLEAIMDALDAHTAMSTQALNSEEVRQGLKEILLTHAELWEELRKPSA